MTEVYCSASSPVAHSAVQRLLKAEAGLGKRVGILSVHGSAWLSVSSKRCVVLRQICENLKQTPCFLQAFVELKPYKRTKGFALAQYARTGMGENPNFKSGRPASWKPESLSCFDAAAC